MFEANYLQLLYNRSVERTYIIYCYTCLITGKKYVGQTCQSLEKRAGKNGSGYRHCVVFYVEIKKYGWENFSVEILEEGLTLEEANEREQYWIKKLGTLAPLGMNLVPGGDNHCHNELTRQKLSEIGKGHKMSDVCKEALRKSRVGSHHTEESKRKMSENRKGKGVGLNREYQSKRVFQYTKDMEFVAEYPSIREASRITGVNRGNIGSCCQGKLYLAGNYIWKYKEVA